MTFTKAILALACLMSGTLLAQESKQTRLLTKDLTEFPNKEAIMFTVDYAPGGSDPVHVRLNSHAFVYMLEGSVVMQVKGGKEITLTPGQSFLQN
jgi:quercetin dioxygenase-like cupin family protein